ncbi:hypothetical protein RIR_jg40046.t1 [Rhizophagus irregularis DAOM 181602=DAOM 197198]|nr:hypothetical protein RIR_jg40046.t1 [Rhizophagus irregularis DAOM 181602=DAOM 197198]
MSFLVIKNSVHICLERVRMLTSNRYIGSVGMSIGVEITVILNENVNIILFATLSSSLLIGRLRVAPHIWNKGVTSSDYSFIADSQIHSVLRSNFVVQYKEIWISLEFTLVVIR